ETRERRRVREGGRPVGAARERRAELADRGDLRREEAGLRELRDLALLRVALLRRLLPERREVRRDRRAVEDLAVVLLVERDERRVVGLPVLVAARIEDLVAARLQQRDEARAERVPVGVVRIHDADVLVRLHLRPQVLVGVGELLRAEAEEERVAERVRAARLRAAAEVERLPRIDRADERDARRLGGVRRRVDDLRGRRREQEVDVVAVDERARDLRRGRRARLAVLVDDLDRVVLSADGQALGEALLRKPDDVRIALAEPGRG